MMSLPWDEWTTSVLRTGSLARELMSSRDLDASEDPGPYGPGPRRLTSRTYLIPQTFLNWAWKSLTPR